MSAVILSAAKNLASTGVSGKILRCAQNDSPPVRVDSRGLTAPGEPASKLWGLLAPGYFILCLLAVGCQQKMAEQPSYKPLDACKFFADGLSARAAVPGTVARGHLETDIPLFTGRRVGQDGQPMGAVTPTVVQPPPGSPEAEQALKARYDQFVDTFPFPMTAAVLQHGHDRYMIYCVVCHDPLGTGHGKIVERGYTPPPSYHIPRLRDAPAGHLFAVVTEGYGSMPSYREQIPVDDRWAIVGYLRALQLSQHFPKSKLKEGRLP
jgi:mono/diheme cytochrome c family protein